MNINDAKKYTLEVMKNEPRISICWVGGSGLGKTTAAYELAKELGLKLCYIPCRNSDGGDVVGMNLPKDKQLALGFVPHERMPIKEAALVYMDEYNRSDKPTRAALMEVINERTCGGIPLHPETLVLLTMNDESDDYDTFEGDASFKTRIVPVPITFDPDCSIEWANKRAGDRGEELSPMAEYIKANPQRLNEKIVWRMEKPDGRFLANLELLYWIKSTDKNAHNEIMRFCLGAKEAGPYLRTKEAEKANANTIKALKLGGLPFAEALMTAIRAEVANGDHLSTDDSKHSTEEKLPF